MPENGLYWSGTVSYGIEASGSASSTGTLPGTFFYTIGGKVESFWADSFLTTTRGVLLQVEETASTRVLTVDIPDIGRSYSQTVGTGTISAEVQLDAKVYVLSTARWYVSVSAVRVYLAGSLASTLGGGTVSSAIQPIPGGVPIFGIPPLVTAIAGAGPIPVQGQVYSPSFGVSASGSATGGVRWKNAGDSTFRTMAVDFSEQDTSINTISGGDTYSVSVSSTFDAFADATSGYENNNGNYAWAFPNSPRSIERINPSDYAALWFRFGMPETEKNYQTAVGYPFLIPPPGDPPLYVVTNTPSTVLGSQSQLLEEVYAAAGTIEDTFSETLCAPFYQSNSEVTWGDGLGTVYVDAQSMFYPSAVDDAGGGSACVPAFVGHSDIQVNLFNTWFSPHWSFAHYFDDWLIDGSPMDQNDYWQSARSQHRSESALPAGGSKKRNHLVSAPLDYSGLLGIQDTTLGDNLRWIGVSRFQVQDENVASSVTLSNSDSGRFTTVEGTVSYSGSSGIEVSSEYAKFELDMLDFGTNPYMVLAYARQIRLAWDSNISSVQCYGVGYDNARVLIGETEDWHDLITGRSSRFAGAWGVDQGFGEITDVGLDGDPATTNPINKPARGASSAIFGASETLLNSTLITGRAYKKLQFIVRLVGSTPGVIEWFQFNTYTGDPDLAYWETGQAHTGIYANGPAIRYGNWDWYLTGVGFQNPPLPTATPSVSTVIDWLCTKRVLIRREPYTGGSPDLTTELASLYDSFEANSVAAVERNSIAFVLPSTADTMRAALVNTVAEVPPVPSLPLNQRDSDYLFSGSLELATYDLSVGVKRIVTYDRQLKLNNGTTDQGVALTVPAGWYGWQFDSAVTGSESWNLVDGTGLKWARQIRPWWGRFAVLSERVTSIPIGASVARDWRHGNAIMKDGEMFVRFANNTDLSFSEEATGKTDITSISTSYNKAGDRQIFYVAVVEGGTGYVYEKDDESGSLTLMITIGTADHVAIVTTEDSMLYTYRLEGGTIYVRAYDGEQSPLYTETATNITGVDDAEIDASYSVNGDGVLRIELTYYVAGVAYYKVSTDGVNFA